MIPAMVYGVEEGGRSRRGGGGGSGGPPWRSQEPSRSRNAGAKREGASRSPALRGASPSGERKRSSILSGSFFSSKRKAATPPPPSSAFSLGAPASARRLVVPSAESILRGVEILQSIFPKWDRSALQMMLEANAYVMEETITAILSMEAAEEASNAERERASGFSLQHPVKNPLPEDFLRLPDDDGSASEDMRSDDERDEDEDLTGDERPSELLVAEEIQSALVETEENEVEEKPAVADALDQEDIRSEKSSILAEDDGTLYGKEFESDGEELKDDVVAPKLNTQAILKNQKIVSDSMNQKFLPAELRDERQSILDTANIDVIKRSKLDLSEAEKRIRHREPHLVFELLTKASEIYRNGIISSHELDTLRSMIVSKIQPSKMLVDMTMNMDKVISDHEWHLLILKAKGIRQALSVRLVNNWHKLNRSGHMEYVVRVVDIESGVVWFTKKRFKEFHKLYRKLCRLSGRVSECVFPARRSHGRTSQRELALERAPLIESFLRTTASLVTPPPATFLHSCALKQLQQFLEVPHEGILSRNRTQPIARELRVYVYHTVNDITSPEGKACVKFLAKLKQNGVDPGKNLLEEVGTILDGVQEYMLEHRFDEMRTHVERLMKYLSTTNLMEETLGRRNSYVSNLLDDDTLTSNDKLQQLISDAIRHELEEKLCVPLMADLTACLRMKVMHKERQFRQRVSELRGKPQSYFGIPVSKISMSSWRSVIDSIKEIDDAFLPLDKMRKLVGSAHQIHALHQSERQMIHTEKARASHSRRHSTTDIPSAALLAAPGVGSPPPVSPICSDDDVLSGDDFLPIFIYVLVHSDLASPIMTQVLLNRLCDPEKRRSESGYYLATFEAALHHILSSESFQDA